MRQPLGVLTALVLCICLHRAACSNQGGDLWGHDLGAVARRRQLLQEPSSNLGTSPSPSSEGEGGGAGPDTAALLAFKASFSNGGEVLTSWTADTSPCGGGWEGVECAGGRVAQVLLPGQGLTGTLPAQGYSLPESTKVLQLSNNSISGTIPEAWRIQAGLQVLRLEANQLDGELPKQLTPPPSLYMLLLLGNKLRGSFPASWALPDSMAFFSLSDNQLTGNLPPDWRAPVNITYLDLSKNAFTGPLPQWSLSERSRLAVLDLSNNRLSGGLPAQWPLPNSLSQLVLSNNALTGAIPSQWTLPSGLKQLQLNNNSLAGPIPWDTWELPSSLEELWLGFNGLTGPVLPTSASQLPQGLVWLDLGFNSLTSDVLPDLSNLTSLEYLSLTSNRLAGSLPEGGWALPPSLQFLFLHNNTLAGPLAIQWPAQLARLFLSENLFTGPLPNPLELPPGLTHLDLGVNEFTSTIPPDLGTLASLQFLTLHENKLVGTIPSGWVLPDLQEAVLSGNTLTGTLPVWNTPLDAIITAVPQKGTELCGEVPPTPVFTDGIAVITKLPSTCNQAQLDVAALLRFKGSMSNGATVLADWSSSDSSACSWMGVNCSSAGQVVGMQLEGKGLQGSIPNGGWSLPSKLQALSLEGSQFGPLPQYWQLPSNLTQLNLRSCAINGTVPKGLLLPADLSQLDLSDNLLSGSLPSNLELPSLKEALLQGNKLAGSLPAWSTPLNASVYVLPQDGTQLCGKVPSSPFFYEAGSNSPLNNNSLPECGSVSPVPPTPPSPGTAILPQELDASSFSWGVVIGAVAGGAVLVVVVAAIVWRRRSRRRRFASLNTEKPGHQSEAAEYTNGTKETSSGEDASSLKSDPVLALALKASMSQGSAATKSRGLSSRGSVPLPLDVKMWSIQFHELQLVKQIGEGSFGRVYLAKWQEQLVAAKILLNTGVDVADEAAMEQALTFSNPVLLNLQKEAGLMAALRHTNVVRFLGVCSCPPCVVTEYCARGSLADVLRAARVNPHLAAQLDWVRRLNMMLDTAKGILHLHSHNPPIIHRDLKSPNLLVDQHWRVKVSDFNLSKLLEDTSILSSAQATNPRWLAPEVLAGMPATLQNDCFSFGVVLWEMLTWELPFQDTNHWQMVRFIADGGRLAIPPRDALPGVNSGAFEGLDDYIALIRRCWSQTPEERPSFKEIIESLRRMLAVALAQAPGQLQLQ